MKDCHARPLAVYLQIVHLHCPQNHNGLVLNAIISVLCSFLKLNLSLSLANSSLSVILSFHYLIALVQLVFVLNPSRNCLLVNFKFLSNFILRCFFVEVFLYSSNFLL